MVKTITEVNYNDLEKVIEDVYGAKYEIPSMEERGSGSGDMMEINIRTKVPLRAYDCEEIIKLRAGKPSQWILRTIMQDMVNNREIPEGFYIVDISW